MQDFLHYLSQHVIDNPDVESARVKTKSLLEVADRVWEQAVENELSDKVLFVNQQAFIRPSRISDLSARVTEHYNGVEYNRPVADLVQQGGGMLGIALAGYSYVMEKAGIRFYSLGGTSAGGINAMLLGTLPDSIYNNPSPFNDGVQASKSELLAHIIMNTRFDKFMDRKGIAGRLQGMVLRNIKSRYLKIMAISVFPLMSIGTYILLTFIFSRAVNISQTWMGVYNFLSGTLAAMVPFLLFYILFVRILGTSFGINSGGVFYNWIRDIISSPFVNICTTTDLNNKLASVGFDAKKESDCARMVLITSNLTYNRIVKFPEKAGEYWDKPFGVSPAAYVRATMSIPFVFETFIPNAVHAEGFDVPKPTPARFVDGGMLSNFPIREFHNNTGQLPRFPTFGVLLNPTDIELENKTSVNESRRRFTAVTLIGYIMSFLTTFRNFYDNDYIRNNEEIKLRVVAVETKDCNWLDFWMSDEKKIQLFRHGAEAAVRQLEKFDFAEYIPIRIKQAATVNHCKPSDLKADTSAIEDVPSPL